MRMQLAGVSVPSESDSQLINNAVRHVFEIPDGHFTAAFRKCMLAFDDRGYTEVSTTNWFRMRTPNFVGIKTVLATAQGYRFEVEFHTPDSYRAKLANHDTYKKLETLQQPGTRDELGQVDANELELCAREVCKRVAIPEGAKDISHFGIDADRIASVSASLELRAAERRIAKIAASSLVSKASSLVSKEIVTALGGRPIVLVGMPGAGKSTIGKRLAKELGLKFIDSDIEIRAETGMSIKKLCETHGEQQFRELEARVIARVLKQGPAVLATGSDSFIHDATRNLIHENAVSIWLKADADVIKRRVEDRSGRRQQQTSDPQAAITQMIVEREPIYQNADLAIVSREVSHGTQVDECVAALHAHLRGQERAAQISTIVEAAE